MTTKETESELTEILNYKFMLSKKIRWNRRVALKIDMAIKSTGYVKNLPELKRLETTGEKLLTTQIKEITKLSNEKIARHLGITYRVVRHQWDEKVRLDS